MSRLLEETSQFKRDWLLVYDKVGPTAGGTLKLIRTGSHSELF